MTEAKRDIPTTAPVDIEKQPLPADDKTAEGEATLTDVETAKAELSKDRNAVSGLLTRYLVGLNGLSSLLFLLGPDGSKLTEVWQRTWMSRTLGLLPSFSILVGTFLVLFLFPFSVRPLPAHTLFKRELGVIWEGGWPGCERPRVIGGVLQVQWRWMFLVQGLMIGSGMWNVWAALNNPGPSKT